MKFKLNLIQASMIAAMSVASAGASAVVFSDFEVTETSVPGTFANIFTADKITGNYVEVITFTPVDATSGTFDFSLKWNAGQFVANDGQTPIATQLSQTNSLFPQQYGLYAFLQGTGTYTSSGAVTQSFFNPGGSLSVWIDPGTNTTFTPPTSGSDAWTANVAADDYEIAFGEMIGGEGRLDPTLSTCGDNPATPTVENGINCGSFGTTTSFLLSAAGSEYFTWPVPFYNVSFQSGQLNNFDVAGTQTVNGSLDVVFASSVPEPSSIALMGLGLVGLGVGLRRRKQA